MSAGDGLRFKLPRSYGVRPGKMVRRNPFLSGETKCFLGPGQQRWDYGQEWHLDQYSLYTIEYEGPTDWSAAGNLLAMPQVVLFGVDIPPVLLNGTSLSGGTNVDLYVPAYGRQEYTRINSLMSYVKGQIERIRPGKTFVTNMLWTTASWLPPQPDDPPIASDTYAQIFEHYMSLDKVTSIVVPSPDYPDHVKTDLLVISVGGSIDVKDLPFAHPFWEYRIHFKELSPEVPPGSSIDDNLSFVMNYTNRDGTRPYQNSIDRMKLNYSKFPRYSAKLYGIHETTEEPDSTYTVPSDVPFDELELANIIWAKHVVAYYEAANRAFVQQTASDLSDCGYSYMGESRLLDEDSMVQLIADHFGFDPETGKDRPIT